MIATATLRSAAREAVVESVAERASYEHKRNYHKLHIHRNGKVSWTESINRTDDIIDDQADYFCAVQSVACVGTGSYSCNCDYCNEVYNADTESLAVEQGREYDKSAKYDNDDEAIAAAVGDSDLSDLEAEMLATFDSIPTGYFDDEPEAR